MRYKMKEKWFTSGREFTVRTESGKEAFLLGPGRGERLSFRDLSRRELASIQPKIVSEAPAYELYYADELHAVVRTDQFQKSSPPPNATFAVDPAGPDDLLATGNFHANEYRFTRDGQTVATVSRAGFAAADSYGIEVSKGEDEVLILASAVVIDLCCHGQTKA